MTQDLISAYERGRGSGGQLPLKRPDFDLYLSERDLVPGASFPPERFRSRDTHLDTLDNIYRGDFRQFVEKPEDVMIPISPARRLVKVQVDLLMMSTPEAAYPLRTVAADAIRDMLVYGGAVIVVDQEGDVDTLEADIADESMEPGVVNIYTVSPLTWYPREEGGAALLRPFISSMGGTDNLADRVEITLLGEHGEMIEVREYHFDGVGVFGTIGPLIEERAASRGGVLLSATSPQEDIWGESILLDLAAPLLELAKRYSQNSQILDKNAKPNRVWQAGTDDSIDMFASEDDDDETAYEKIAKGFGERAEKGDVWLGDRTQKVSYLEFSGNLPGSFEQIQSVREMIAQLSGLPAILDSLVQASPSGVSLRLQYLPFFAATSALQQDLAEVLSDALALGGLAPDIEWPHIFDVMDAERQQVIAQRTESWGAGI